MFMMLISLTRGSRFRETQLCSNFHSVIRATYNTQVVSISERGNKSTTKFPVKESLGETKRPVFYEPSECCRLKGKTQQEASIFRMAVVAGCEVKAPFIWAVWRVEFLETGSKGAVEIKHPSWMKSLYQSLSEHLLCKSSERQSEKQVKSKVNYWS